MTEQDIEHIRRTWAMAAAIPEQTATVFYGKLFRLDASTKPLFVGDLHLQGRKLTQTLTFIVDHLDDTEVLLQAARDLAIRHVDYGVAAAQYASVGSALIATLDQLLGPEFTAEDEAAWLRVYTVLSEHMTESAYG